MCPALALGQVTAPSLAEHVISQLDEVQGDNRVEQLQGAVRIAVAHYKMNVVQECWGMQAGESCEDFAKRATKDGLRVGIMAVTPDCAGGLFSAPAMKKGAKGQSVHYHKCWREMLAEKYDAPDDCTTEAIMSASAVHELVHAIFHEGDPRDPEVRACWECEAYCEEADILCWIKENCPKFTALTQIATVRRMSLEARLKRVCELNKEFCKQAEKPACEKCGE